MESPYKTIKAKAEAMVDSWKACQALMPDLFKGAAQADMVIVAESYLDLLAALKRIVAKHRDAVFICGPDDEAPVAFALNEAENAIAKAEGK